MPVSDETTQSHGSSLASMDAMITEDIQTYIESVAGVQAEKLSTLNEHISADGLFVAFLEYAAPNGKQKYQVNHDQGWKGCRLAL